MTTLTCPKCRQAMPDGALDVGHCPACGFALDGPLLFTTPGPRFARARLLIATGVVALLAGLVGYTFLGRPSTALDPEAADRDPADAPIRFVAPFPHEPKGPESGVEPQTDPAPVPQEGTNGDKEPPVDPPNKVGPRPVGVVMKVDPRIAPRRHFDHPDDTAALPDLNTNDRVVLTGRVRALRLGSVNGKGSVDASRLVAEEVIITGDMNGEAAVTVTVPNGKVTIGGYVAGVSKLTIRAPGGAVVLAGSGRFTGGSTIAITARRLEAAGVLSGGTKVDVTFTAGGSLKLTRAEGAATVTYKKVAAGDRAPAIEKGELRDSAKVLAQ